MDTKFIQIRGINKAVIEGDPASPYTPAFTFYSTAFDYGTFPQVWDMNPEPVPDQDGNYNLIDNLAAINGHAISNITFRNCYRGLEFSTGCSYRVIDCKFDRCNIGILNNDMSAMFFSSHSNWPNWPNSAPQTSAIITQCQFLECSSGLQTTGWYSWSYADGFEFTPGGEPRCSLVMSHCLFKNNAYGFTGAAAGASFDTCAWLNNTSVAVNITALPGMALSNNAVFGQCTFKDNGTDVEYYGNYVSSNGFILDPGQPAFYGSILWGSSNHFAPYSYWDTMSPPLLYNTTISPPPVFEFDDFNLDPQFIWNTPYLQAGSPVIDQGSPAYTGGMDLDGNPRSNPPDRGAYEYVEDMDSDGDSLTDRQERLAGLDPLDSSDAWADNDLDGFANQVEFLNGTDMNSASSAPVAGSIYVDPSNGNDSFPGTSAAPVRSINRAIILANSTPSTEPTKTIFLQEGTYVGAANRNWSLPYTRTIRIEAVSGPERTVVDLQNEDRAVIINGNGFALEVRGVTFRNGFAKPNATAGTNGGAVFVKPGLGNRSLASVRFVTCNFVGCVASGDGGAAFINVNARSTIEFNYCKLLANQAKNGGAIALSSQLSGVRVYSCEFSYNEAITSGGALYDAGGGNPALSSYSSANPLLSISYSQFNYNLAGSQGINPTTAPAVSPDGGAICINPRAGSLSSKISACSFVANSAFGSGGAVSVAPGGPVLDNCEFAANIASGFAYLGAANTAPAWLNRMGGAIAIPGIAGIASPSVTRCRILGNYVEGKGGAIASNAGNLSILESAICRNHALTGGGGVYVDGVLVAQITHATIVNNSAGSGAAVGEQGGGILRGIGPVVRLDSSILWNNLGIGTSRDNYSPVLALTDAAASPVGTFQYSNIEGGGTSNGGAFQACVSRPPFFTKDGYHLHRNSLDRSGGRVVYNGGDIDWEVIPGYTYRGCDLFIDSDNDGLADSVEQAIITADTTGRYKTLADVLPSDDVDGNGRTNAQDNNAGSFAPIASLGGIGGFSSNPIPNPIGTIPTTNSPEDTTDPADKDTDGDGLSDAEERRLATNPDSPDTDGDTVWDGAEEHPLDKALTFAPIGTPQYLVLDVGEGTVIDVNNKGQVLYSKTVDEELAFYRWSPGKADPDKLTSETHTARNANPVVITRTTYSVIGDDGKVGGVTTETRIPNPSRVMMGETTISDGLLDPVLTKTKIAIVEPDSTTPTHHEPQNDFFPLDPDSCPGSTPPAHFFGALPGSVNLAYLDKNGLGYGSSANRSIALWGDGDIFSDLQYYTFEEPAPDTVATSDVMEGLLSAASPGGRCIYRKFQTTYLTSRSDTQVDCDGNGMDDMTQTVYSVSKQADPPATQLGTFFHQEGPGYNDRPGLATNTQVFPPLGAEEDPANPRTKIVCVNDMAQEDKPTGTNLGQAYNPGMMIGGSYDGMACFWTLKDANGNWEKHFIESEDENGNTSHVAGEVTQIQDNGTVWIADGSEVKLWKDRALHQISEYGGQGIPKKVTTGGMICSEDEDGHVLLCYPLAVTLQEATRSLDIPFPFTSTASPVITIDPVTPSNVQADGACTVQLVGHVKDPFADIVPDGAADITHIKVGSNSVQLTPTPIAAKPGKPFPFDGRFTATITVPAGSSDYRVFLETTLNAIGRTGKAVINVKRSVPTPDDSTNGQSIPVIYAPNASDPPVLLEGVEVLDGAQEGAFQSVRFRVGQPTLPAPTSGGRRIEINDSQLSLPLEPEVGINGKKTGYLTTKIFAVVDSSTLAEEGLSLRVNNPAIMAISDSKFKWEAKVIQGPGSFVHSDSSDTGTAKLKVQPHPKNTKNPRTNQEYKWPENAFYAGPYWVWGSDLKFDNGDNSKLGTADSEGLIELTLPIPVELVTVDVSLQKDGKLNEKPLYRRKFTTQYFPKCASAGTHRFWNGKVNRLSTGPAAEPADPGFTTNPDYPVSDLMSLVAGGVPDKPKQRVTVKLVGFDEASGIVTFLLIAKNTQVQRVGNITNFDTASQAVIREWAAARQGREEAGLQKYITDLAVEAVAYPYFLDPYFFMKQPVTEDTDPEPDPSVTAKVSLSFGDSKLPAISADIRSFAKKLFVYDRADKNTRGKNTRGVTSPGNGQVAHVPNRADVLPVDSISYLWAGLLEKDANVPVGKLRIKTSRHYLQQNEETMPGGKDGPDPSTTVIDYGDGYSFRDVYIRLTERGKLTSVGHGSANPNGIFLEEHQSQKWHPGFVANEDPTAEVGVFTPYPLPPLKLYTPLCRFNHCYAGGSGGLTSSSGKPAAESFFDVLKAGVTGSKAVVKGAVGLCETEWEPLWRAQKDKNDSGTIDEERWGQTAAVLRKIDTEALPVLGDPLFERDNNNSERANNEMDVEVWQVSVTTPTALVENATTEATFHAKMPVGFAPPPSGSNLILARIMGAQGFFKPKNDVYLGTVTVISHSGNLISAAIKGTVVRNSKPDPGGGGSLILLSPDTVPTPRWGGSLYHFRWFLHNYEIENGQKEFVSEGLRAPKDSRFHQVQETIKTSGDWLDYIERLGPTTPDGYRGVVKEFKLSP